MNLLVIILLHSLFLIFAVRQLVAYNLSNFKTLDGNYSRVGKKDKSLLRGFVVVLTCWAAATYFVHF